MEPTTYLLRMLILRCQGTLYRYNLDVHDYDLGNRLIVKKRAPLPTSVVAAFTAPFAFEITERLIRGED